VIGHQLHSQLGTDVLPHSGISLIIGIIGATLGGRGMANAFQNSLNTLWNVPKVDRPGFPRSYLRTFGLLGLLGLGAILTALAGGAVDGAGRLVGLPGLPIHIAGIVALMALDAGLFLAASGWPPPKPFRPGTCGPEPSCPRSRGRSCSPSPDSSSSAT
jgi:uncharacterized BrkB/YihY/UPF0761 family membrane protein